MHEVEAFSAADAWVTEWQYGVARELLLARAEVMLWLDLPIATVMRQVTQRTLRRRLRGEVLWNGNVEPPLSSLLTDPDHIIRWAWKTRHKAARRVDEALRRRPELDVCA